MVQFKVIQGSNAQDGLDRVLASNWHKSEGVILARYLCKTFYDEVPLELGDLTVLVLFDVQDPFALHCLSPMQ